MINTTIKFPASYTNTLTPYETEYLAVSLGGCPKIGNITTNVDMHS